MAVLKGCRRSRNDRSWSEQTFREFLRHNPSTSQRLQKRRKPHEALGPGAVAAFTVDVA
jgi:hypothetical protein